MDQKIKDAFRRALENLLDEADLRPGPNNSKILPSPRYLFWVAEHSLKVKKLNPEDRWELVEIFLKFLDQKNIKISKKARRYFMNQKPKFKPSREMMRGAWAAEYRHPADAKGH
jgi:hypothetical protein